MPKEKRVLAYHSTLEAMRRAISFGRNHGMADIMAQTGGMRIRA